MNPALKTNKLLVTIPSSTRWVDKTDPLTVARLLREIRSSRRQKAPGRGGLSPTLFKGSRVDLVRELLVLFSEIWYHEKVDRCSIFWQALLGGSADHKVWYLIFAYKTQVISSKVPGTCAYAILLGDRFEVIICKCLEIPIT